MLHVDLWRVAHVARVRLSPCDCAERHLACMLADCAGRVQAVPPEGPHPGGLREEGDAAAADCRGGGGWRRPQPRGPVSNGTILSRVFGLNNA